MKTILRSIGARSVPHHVYNYLILMPPLPSAPQEVNRTHESLYLPGVKLPDNVVACSSLEETVKGADILIFWWVAIRLACLIALLCTRWYLLECWPLSDADIITSWDYCVCS